MRVAMKKISLEVGLPTASSLAPSDAALVFAVGDYRLRGCKYKAAPSPTRLGRTPPPRYLSVLGGVEGGAVGLADFFVYRDIHLLFLAFCYLDKFYDSHFDSYSDNNSSWVARTVKVRSEHANRRNPRSAP